LKGEKRKTKGRDGRHKKGKRKLKTMRVKSIIEGYHSTIYKTGIGTLFRSNLYATHVEFDDPKQRLGYRPLAALLTTSSIEKPARTL